LGLALLKLLIHARSGGTVEVMGMLLGKIDGQTMIIMDSFTLPITRTGELINILETRVIAQREDYEYMHLYTLLAKEINLLENIIGWYHSHPGYGCWLTGIDVDVHINDIKIHLLLLLYEKNRSI
jgi:COP9 signalosome complex subunit 5